MSKEVSSRGTYLKVANSLRETLRNEPGMSELPSQADIVRQFGVSRGVAIRAVNVLKNDGLVEAVPGSRWRVVRNGQHGGRQVLAEKIAAVISEDKLEVGDSFPSATVLCERFGVSRPTVRRALDKLEAQGLLSEGSQGKVRTVLALPGQEGTTKP